MPFLNNRFIYDLLLLLGVVIIYLLAAYFFPYTLESTQHAVARIIFPQKVPPAGSYDKFGRLISYSDKKQVVCPVQTKDVGVILAFGQSNSANHASKKFVTQYPDKVLNYFNGKCYVAASPLLGATYDGGEFLTPLADKLIENSTYTSVIIISSGIGGTAIDRWQRNGDLNQMLLKVIDEAKNHYTITDIIWHQGESDYVYKTTEDEYKRSFYSLAQSLREKGVTAPVFISIATKCTPTPAWTTDNPTALAQHHLVDNKSIFLGVDSDTLLTDQDRAADNCHLAMTGQLKIADAFFTAINNVHKGKY